MPKQTVHTTTATKAKQEQQKGQFLIPEKPKPTKIKKKTQSAVKYSSLLGNISKPTTDAVDNNNNTEIDGSESDFSFEEEHSDESAHSYSSDLSTTTSSVDEFRAGVLKIALDKETNRKLLSEVETKKKKVTEIKPTDPRGVIYLGHLPFGFFEDQMKSFFSQFGVVTQLRLSRNKKTGQSKHYAFVEFLDPIVAKIVADTMNGYIMFSRVLVCNVIPPDQVHQNMFKGANKKNFPHNSRIVAEKQVNKKRTKTETHNRQRRLLAKEKLRRKKLEKLGISYQFPGFSADVSTTVIEKKGIDKTKSE